MTCLTVFRGVGERETIAGRALTVQDCLTRPCDDQSSSRHVYMRVTDDKLLHLALISSAQLNTSGKFVDNLEINFLLAGSAELNLLVYVMHKCTKCSQMNHRSKW